MSKFNLLLFQLLFFLQFVYPQSEKEVLSWKRIAHENRDSTAVYAYNKLSYYYYLIRAPQCKEYADSALRLATELNHTRGQALAYYNLGNWASIMAKSDLALQLYNKAGKFFDELHDNHYQSVVANSIGYIYSERGESLKAIDYYLLGVEFALRQNDKANLALLYLNIGSEYLSMEEYENCLLYANSSIALSKEINDQATLAYNLLNVAGIKTQQKKYEDAQGLLTEALTIFKQKNMYGGIIDAYQSFAQVFILQHELNRALFFLQEAERTATNNKLHKELLDIYERKVTIFKEKKDFQQQAVFLQKINELKDFVHTANHNKDLEEAHAQFRFENEQSELTLLAQTEEKMAKERIKQNILRNTLLIGILIFIIFAYYIFKGYRQQQKLNLELEKQKKELEEINQVKDKLFSIISHDLRNPLSSLHSFLTLLNIANLSQEKLKTYSEQLNTTLNNTLNLIDNLLNWAISQMNSVVVEPRLINLSSLVEENINLLNVESTKKRILIYNFLKDSDVCWADFNMISLVVRNLITNAIKFSYPEGKIVISARKRGSKIDICFEDNGIGMNEDILSKILSQKLYHSTPGTAKEKGTGLGLMLCCDFIEKNKGTITVESELEKGSKFYISLPLEKSTFD